VFAEDQILLLREMKSSGQVSFDRGVRVLKKGAMNCMWKASS